MEVIYWGLALWSGGRQFDCDPQKQKGGDQHAYGQVKAQRGKASGQKGQKDEERRPPVKGGEQREIAAQLYLTRDSM